MPICAASGKKFEISEDDLEFYKKIGVPAPTLCPEERQRRRMSFRNERNLYHRVCDASGAQIISNISSDKPHKVFEKDIWWSDEWDPKDYGRSYDFSRPFFEQFHELRLQAPRMNLFSKGSENCDYTNHATYNKNCYMLFNATKCEDVHYSTNYVLDSKNCIDCYSIDRCELLYNSFLCELCYNSTDLVNSKNCRDSAFLYDCRSCENCTMCWGLRNKKYCIENRQFSREEYEKSIKQFDRGSYAQYVRFQERFRQVVRENAIHRSSIIDNCENCTGDYIFNSKNTLDSYYAIQCEDSRFIYDGFGHKDSYDCYESAFETERQYECYGCNFTKFSFGAMISHECNNVYYTDYCFNSRDLFGCVSMKRAEYCILNKQYSYEEYEELKARIINHMKSTGEWGEFMPSKYSPFAYNESVAQDFMPLTRKEAEQRRLKWRETGTRLGYRNEAFRIPDHIRDVIGDDICNMTLMCEATAKYYKLIPQELAFYRRLNIPVPRKCFDARLKERLQWRNPRQLWERKCNACADTIMTSYSAERPEKVYCESCYQKAIY